MTHQTLSLRKYWKLVPSTLINQALKNPAMDLHFNSTKKRKVDKKTSWQEKDLKQNCILCLNFGGFSHRNFLVQFN